MVMTMKCSIRILSPTITIVKIQLPEKINDTRNMNDKFTITKSINDLNEVSP